MPSWSIRKLSGMARTPYNRDRSEEHTSELQSQLNLVCRLLLEKKKGEDAQLLPALRNGEITQLENPTIEDKGTRPPPRYNEGTLIGSMQKPWRSVDNEVLRERL